jgi:hypothetical protein
MWLSLGLLSVRKFYNHKLAALGIRVVVSCEPQCWEGLDPRLGVFSHHVNCGVCEGSLLI